MEHDYAAHNYHPLDVVIDRAKDTKVWDPEGNEYFDFLSAYSAVNQGHCHPKIISALTEQAQTCTLTSRAFYNAQFPHFAKYVTEYFGFESVLPMNTGAEGIETALKLARAWGYQKKGIEEGKAICVGATGCFHGRTMTAVSMSDDPSSYDGFSPYLPGIMRVQYDDIESLRQTLEAHGDQICAFMVEPIQGEAGVKMPKDGYLAQAAELCRQHNVLFVADEVQTGLCRTGKMLACDWDEVRPDMLVLGKAISGGVLPLSVVLADKDIMHCIAPGTHGSTYGGNPLASAVGIAALQVLKEENLAENSAKMGSLLLENLKKIKSQCDFVKEVRGRGLFCAIEVDKEFHTSAWDICVKLKDSGLLAKPTHETIIRLAPPLTITESQIAESSSILERVFTSLKDE